MPVRERSPAQCRRRRTDHPFRQGPGALLARVDPTDHSALAQDGRGVAEIADLVELVGDVENARSLGRELAQHAKELADRERRQHRRGLVHDQELRLLEQVSHHLDPLLFTDGKGVHGARGIDGDAVAGGDLPGALRNCAEIARPRQGECDVLRHAEGGEEREVLEHHADAERPRVCRGPDGGRDTFPEDAARVRAHHAVDDLHQRALAGTVLSEQRVNRPGGDREVDPVVRDDGGERLADALELQAERRRGTRHFRHAPAPMVRRRSLDRTPMPRSRGAAARLLRQPAGRSSLRGERAASSAAHAAGSRTHRSHPGRTACGVGAGRS